MNKYELAKKINGLEGLTNDEKSELIKLLRSQKKYGLVWEDKPEDAEQRMVNEQPVLVEVPERAILSDDAEAPNHILIEGDNLEALTALSYTHAGKIDVIYIDPPYNTGNKDFSYNDTFIDRENGYRHSMWLSFMDKRLEISKNLLSSRGTIFISIDDNEVENLRKVCDEVFGEQNFIATLIWERAFAPKNDAKFISSSHDYIVMCAKRIENFKIGRLERTQEANARYSNPDNDPRGVWTSGDMLVKTYNKSCDYPITTPSGKIVNPVPGRCWRFSEESFLEKVKDNRIWFGPEGNGVPRVKRFLSELKFEGMAPTSILFHKEVGHSQEGSKEVTALFGDKGVFDGPKPVRLLQRLLTLANLDDNSIILDFFSGSASTAHAVMKMNAEKQKHCPFIMVQLPEHISEKKKEQGYETVCEIGKERIRRAGKKIKEESPLTTQDLDTGFRVLKLDSTNMQDIYYSPKDISQADLFSQVDNVKPDRTGEDLLFQVMLELGATLDSKIETTTVAGKTIYNVAEGYLVACFDPDVTDDVVKAIAQMQPAYAVLRDTSMKDDSTATNFEQIFKTYSPDTVTKIL